MTKKTTRNITLAITSALLIYASTQINLSSKEENLQSVSVPVVILSTPEPERTVTEPQGVVLEEEQVAEFSEDVPEESPTQLPKENELVPTTSPQQATTLTQKQADTVEPVTTVNQAEATKPTYTEEQLTDPSQKPDGTPVEVYLQDVTPLTPIPEENSTDLAYVPGFGWVPLPDPCEVIFAEDMYMNGNKVGTMGGG
ncbi:MAG: hypothetical protein R3Y63_14245 [Eubacteriales bacterium]